MAELPEWSFYNNVTAKTLLTKGAMSDVLSDQIADEMCTRGPQPDYHVFDDCGHAPTFTSVEAITLLASFFAEPL